MADKSKIEWTEQTTVDTSAAAIGAVLEGVTAGPWVLEMKENWPFNLEVRPSVLHITRIASSSSAKTLSDIRNGIGFPLTDRDEVIEMIEREEANLRFIAAARDLVPALSAQLTAETARADELASAIDSIETSEGLTSNGNLWRFWSKKSRDLVEKCDELRVRADAAEAERNALQAMIDAAVKEARAEVRAVVARRVDWNASTVRDDLLLAIDLIGGAS